MSVFVNIKVGSCDAPPNLGLTHSDKLLLITWKKKSTLRHDESEEKDAPALIPGEVT